MILRCLEADNNFKQMQFPPQDSEILRLRAWTWSLCIVNQWDLCSIFSISDSKIFNGTYNCTKTWQDFYCETQPPASIGWVALSSLVCRSSVPHCNISSPLYDVSDHTNHIYSVRISSWQHVSVIHCWVEPSLLLSSLCQNLHKKCKIVSFWSS